MPVKKKRARKTSTAGITGRKGAGSARSFRDFARKLRPDNLPLKSFKAYAQGEEFPSGESWQEVRGFLVRNGAEHEALVGARMAWRDFRGKFAE